MTAAFQLRTPLLYPDEYVHTALARSIVDGTFPQFRGGSISFFSYLAPLLMSPAWLIDDVDVAYRAAQALGSVAFAAAAFPAYALARRIGVSESGAVVAALLTLAIPNGVWTMGMLAEPYAYPLVIVGTLLAVEAIARPTVPRQLAVVAIACLLPLLGGAQFVFFGLAYLPASYLAGPRSPRAYVRRQVVVVVLLAAAAVAAVAVVAVGSERVHHTYETATISFHYPVVSSVEWFGVNLFVLAIGAGWVVVPGAAVGLWALVRSADGRQRAFAFLSLFVILALVLEAMPFGVNANTVLERYAYYGAPLIVIAFVWALEPARSRRRAYAVVAYVSAAAVFVLPVLPPLLGATITESASLRALSKLTFGVGPPIWGPLLAAAMIGVGLWGAAHARSVVVAATAICLLTTAGVSLAFVEHTRAETEVPRADVRSGASFVTWEGAPGLDLMSTLFWNRAIKRVLVLGPGIANDGYPSQPARLTARGIVDAEGRIVHGPYVFGPDTLVVGEQGATHERGMLTTLRRPPSLVAFGWGRPTHLIDISGWIFARGGARPARIAGHVRSVDGDERTMRFDCGDGLNRTLVVGARATAFSIPVPRGRAQACHFGLVGGSFHFVEGHAASVAGELRLEAAGR